MPAMRRLLLLLLLFSAPAMAQCAGGGTCTLADGNAATVANAVASVNTNGTLIIVPSGTFSWSTPESMTTAYSLTIQGQSTISGGGNNCGGGVLNTSPCTATDNTVILDAQSCGGNCLHLFSITVTGGGSQVVEVTGLSFNENNNGAYYNGMVSVSADAGFTTGGVRVDHCHFYNKAALITATYMYLNAHVLFDHNVFDGPADSTYGSFWLLGDDGNGTGDIEWNAATNLGGNNFLVMENNTINNGSAIDSRGGGRYRFRYNTYRSTGGSNDPTWVQCHATGSNAEVRGCRAWEVYGNYIYSANSGGYFSAGFMTSGTGVWWGNTVTGFNHMLTFVDDRGNNGTYPQTAPAAGWGNCGTAQTGSASNWDGNKNLGGSNGSPCLDMIGRGQGDLLSGTFPNRCDSTLGSGTPGGCGSGTYTGVWSSEYLEPVYEFDDTFTQVGAGNLAFAQTDGGGSPNPANIVANRDYYIQQSNTSPCQTTSTSPFNGTSGTGCGTLANRPTSCTPGLGSADYASPTGSYGVAYFATDANGGRGELYSCTSTNTWTGIYEPAVYPDPLVGGVTATPPAPSTMFVLQGNQGILKGEATLP